jgi:hypothetical protein
MTSINMNTNEYNQKPGYVLRYCASELSIPNGVAQCNINCIIYENNTINRFTKREYGYKYWIRHDEDPDKELRLFEQDIISGIVMYDIMTSFHQLVMQYYDEQFPETGFIFSELDEMDYYEGHNDVFGIEDDGVYYNNDDSSSDSDYDDI